MEKVNVIHANEFADYLRQNGLVIISAAEVSNIEMVKINQLRADLRRKKALTLTEIVEAKLLAVKSQQALRHWIKNGKIRENEFFKDSNGHVQITWECIHRISGIK